MDRRRPRACHTRLDHVEDVVVEEAAEDQVVGSLLRVRAKGKQRRVVLLREELHGRRVLKRVHRVVPPQVHACRGGTEAVSGVRATPGHQGGCVFHAEEERTVRLLQHEQVDEDAVDQPGGLLASHEQSGLRVLVELGLPIPQEAPGSRRLRGL